MPTTYIDQFFVMDPGNPPANGTALSVVKYNIIDQNNDNWVSTGVGDMVDGLTVSSVWVGDTITVVMGGVTQTITGVTFYRTGGAAVFTPTDGTVLDNATFVSSTFVNSSTQTPISSFGPPCLVAGTMVLTPEGEKPVEWLRVGDRVMTRDGGAQPIRWIGARDVAGNADFAPIRFAPGAIGNTRALHVSPQHRILMTGWRAELYCGTSEVLVAAGHLLNGRNVTRAHRAEVSYFHLMFDSHQIIQSDGAETESFFPGDAILAGDRAIRAELNALFPKLHCELPPEDWQTARPVARGAAMRCLVA